MLVKEENNTLASIDLNLKKLEDDLSNGEHVITSYYNHLRTKIISNENQLNEINEIEQETVKNFLQLNKEKFSNKYAEMREQLSSLNESIEKAIDLQSKLFIEKENLLAFIFNNKILEFNTQNNELEMKMFYSINFSQLNKLDLAEIFEPVKQSYMENYEEKKVFTNVIGFGFFKNGNFIVIACFHDNSKSGNLNLFLFDKNKSLIKTSKISNAFAGDMQIVGNKVSFMFYTLDNKSILRVIDEDLQVLNEVETSQRGIIGANESFIILTPEKSSHKLIYYDWTLKMVKKNDKYKFKSEIFDLKINNGKYYFIEYENFKFCLKIVDVSTGVCLKSIGIKGFSSLHYDISNHVVIVYDGLKIVYLSHLGEVLNMVKLVGFPEPDTSRWSMDYENNFYILEENNLCLSIKNK